VWFFPPSECLDLAVQSLFNLQSGGRLVAVISHVAELGERIDTRLEVIAGKTGSRTRFVRR
jgi:exonuclease SbcC